MDPISDMLTRVRNSLKEDKLEILIPHSRIKYDIAIILRNEGFFSDVEIIDDKLVQKKIRVTLKYISKGRPVLSSIKRVSKLSKRIYIKKCEVPKVLNGFGISIISTSKGILSGRDARLKNVGGEYLVEAY